MDIWRPALNKISHIKENKTRYWDILLDRSQYTEAEILAALAEIETVNDEWQALQAEVYKNVLTDKNGPMGTVKGYATGAHREIHEAILDGNGYIYPAYSQNSHKNCYPVQKWQKDVARTRKEIAKIRKMIEAL